ncbi:MAG TPA: PTS sugar transporter subunit IIA [Anaerolineaceae bacterium]|jgi:PTS system galactitol-specific IIA component|nr:PTS sugar transporter subunit IIA [Anaerolineaceae bacterium]
MIDTTQIRLPIQEENILILSDPADARDVIVRLSNLLEQRGDVKPTFVEAVWEREQNMPTGLELEGEIHAAIPHAEVEHVINPTVGLAILEYPVTFKCMVEPDKDLDVRLVFLLAMNEPKKQIEMLQQVAMILQNPELVQRLSAASSTKEVMELIGKIDST